MTITTSLVIPAHNESARLAQGYARLRPTLERMSGDATEIIVIDDGSEDDTMRVAHSVYGHLAHTLFVRQEKNLGKGAAVRLGIGLARGDFVVCADADMSIDPRHIPDIVTGLEHSALVPGSRALEGRIHYDAPLRSFANNAFHHLVHHYAGVTIRDTQCGCKGFQRGPARVLALLGMINGFAYDAEMFFLADRLALGVSPQSVTWRDVGGSSVRLGRDSRTMVRDLRALRRTHYVNPVVTLDRDASLSSVALAARHVRAPGLVLARGDADSLLVLARDGALGGVSLAHELGGTLGTASLEDLRGRSFEAV